MSSLIAQSFLNDPLVISAKQSLLAALKQHQQSIDGIRPPDQERAQSYEETIAAFNQVRGGNLYFPYLGSGIGRGSLVELEDGSVKYDFINGIGVHHFGHSHPQLIEAAIEAALGDTIMQGNLQQNKASYTFSRRLVDAANANGARFDHCFLTSTGVMAGENALKIAMQKKHPANRVIAFERCFAGRTMTFSQITDKPGFRAGLPVNLTVDYVPFYDEQRPEESTRASIKALKSHLQRYPGQHAAMVFELIQGEGGFYTAPPEFHRALMETCQENNVAVLVDEVQTFSRTTELFAFQYLGLDDMVDLVWLGKASQVCATLFRKDYAPKPGLLSQTFTASSTAIAAGSVILDELLTGGYFGTDGKIAAFHEHFKNHLEAIDERNPGLIAGPWGLGAMVAFTPFQGDAAKAGALTKALYNNGVMGFVAGGQPTRLRFLLPVGGVELKDIDEVAKIIEQTLVSMAD
ncbi:MAG: aminotransferase class III-fold pyridoxal phosphate-dependent enzyme [Gammaproteobacteria bacterium]|nr:aminotransferase class III-fold pyridoxal phosphate-dependent enzyme [Gammaproteobacteria bacterium]